MNTGEKHRKEISRDKKPHGKNLRKGRFSEVGRIYVITMVTRDRRPVFADFSAARAVVRVMMGHKERAFAHTLCFVVMPDHIHWLIQLGKKKDLSVTVQSCKSMISRKIGRSVFQRGFYDHALRKEEDARAMARYIVANPLRAGLVTDIHDYPHWDAVWME